MMWSREEALTRINALDFVGLPSAHYGSQAFPMMQEKEQGGNTLTMVVQRFYGQILQIQVSDGTVKHHLVATSIIRPPSLL